MATLNPQETRQLKSLEEIRHCDSFEVFSSALGDIGKPFSAMPAPDEFTSDWSGVEYDADLVGRVPRFERIAAHWTTLSSLPDISGEFSIDHLFEVLVEPSAPWAKEEPTEFRSDFVSNLRRIDATPSSGSGRMSFLRVQPHVNPWEVWYQDMAPIGGDPYPPGYVRLDLSYSQYLDALLLTKGAVGWQYLYADVSLREASWRHVTDPLKSMLNIFPDLFPDYDYSPLRRRLEARL